MKKSVFALALVVSASAQAAPTAYDIRVDMNVGHCIEMDIFPEHAVHDDEFELTISDANTGRQIRKVQAYTDVAFSSRPGLQPDYSNGPLLTASFRMSDDQAFKIDIRDKDTGFFGKDDIFMQREYNVSQLTSGEVLAKTMYGTTLQCLKISTKAVTR